MDYTHDDERARADHALAWERDDQLETDDGLSRSGGCRGVSGGASTPPRRALVSDLRPSICCRLPSWPCSSRATCPRSKTSSIVTTSTSWRIGRCPDPLRSHLSQLSDTGLPEDPGAAIADVVEAQKSVVQGMGSLRHPLARFVCKRATSSPGLEPRSQLRHPRDVPGTVRRSGRWPACGWIGEPRRRERAGNEGLALPPAWLRPSRGEHRASERWLPARLRRSRAKARSSRVPGWPGRAHVERFAEDFGDYLRMVTPAWRRSGADRRTRRADTGRLPPSWEPEVSSGFRAGTGRPVSAFELAGAETLTLEVPEPVDGRPVHPQTRRPSQAGQTRSLEGVNRAPNSVSTTRRTGFSAA